MICKSGCDVMLSVDRDICKKCLDMVFPYKLGRLSAKLLRMDNFVSKDPLNHPPK